MIKTLANTIAKVIAKILTGQAAAAAAPTPPGAPTGWLNVQSEAAGAFGTVANQGSVVANWVRNATSTTVEEGGPNSLKYVHSAKAANDYAKLSGKTWADLVDADNGMIGVIVRQVEIDALLDSANAFSTNGPVWDTAPYLGIGSHSTNGLTPFVRGGSENSQLALAYTANTWRVVVMRWQRGAVNKLFGKINGGSWVETAHSQDIFALTGAVIVAKSFLNRETMDVAEMLAYDGVQLEAAGDDLGGYLATRAGLTW